VKHYAIFLGHDESFVSDVDPESASGLPGESVDRLRHDRRSLLPAARHDRSKAAASAKFEFD
jgi:hypothetical protein